MSQRDLVEKLERISQLTEECLAELNHVSPTTKKSKKVATPRSIEHSRRIDFQMPLRPFIKQYAKRMSGPKKFTLLLARLVKGDPKKELSLGEMKKHWNKMTSLMGMDFNRFFPAQAKDNDWVESKRKGFYNLRPNWKEIFSH